MPLLQSQSIIHTTKNCQCAGYCNWRFELPLSVLWCCVDTEMSLKKTEEVSDSYLSLT